MEIWRVTRPEFGFQAPPPTSISQISSRFSLSQESVIYCSQNSSTALREVLQVFYSRKTTSNTLPIAWSRQHVLLKGKLLRINGEIIDIETASVQRELDIYLGSLLDKYGIPHIDTSILRGNCLEITHAISHWAFHKKKAAGVLFRSKFESNGICYAFYTSRVGIELIESRALVGKFDLFDGICHEYGLKIVQ